MQTQITIAKHPIHAMLVGFPIAFYTATVAAFLAYQYSDDSFWFQLGYVANIAGVVMGLVAAIPGLIDLWKTTSRGSSAQATGIYHAGFQVTALFLFAFNAWLKADQWGSVIPTVNGAIVLTMLGLICSWSGACYGWSLVQNHHLGVLGVRNHGGAGVPQKSADTGSHAKKSQKKAG